MPATDVPQEVAHDVEIDGYRFAELVDDLVGVIRVEHDQEHTAAPAMWCEHTIFATGKLWSSFPGLLNVADELVKAVRAEHDRAHAAPATFCNHPLCVTPRSLGEGEG